MKGLENETCGYRGGTIQIRGKNKHKSLEARAFWEDPEKARSCLQLEQSERGEERQEDGIREAVGGWSLGQVGPYGGLWLFLGLRRELLGFLGRGMTFFKRLSWKEWGTQKSRLQTSKVKMGSCQIPRN